MSKENEWTNDNEYLLIGRIIKTIDEELSYGYTVRDNQLAVVKVNAIGGKDINISSAMLCSLEIIGVIDEQYLEGVEPEIPFSKDELNALTEILDGVIKNSLGDTTVDIVTKLKQWDNIAKKLGVGSKGIGIPVDGTYQIKELDYETIT